MKWRELCKKAVKAAIPYLKKQGGGKIITIGSGLGHKGRSDNAAYSCSKAGLWMLTRVLAQELHKFNISVNELIPGLLLQLWEIAVLKTGIQYFQWIVNGLKT